MFTALYLEEDILYNFDPNKSPVNEAETEILIKCLLYKHHTRNFRLATSLCFNFFICNIELKIVVTLGFGGGLNYTIYVKH